MKTPVVPSGRAFTWPVRVYYEDTDAGGLVYHSRYLHFLERARTEWLRALGFEQDVLAKQMGILFAVRRIEIDFLRPAHFNEQLLIRSHLLELRRVSITFNQNIELITDSSQLIHAQIQIACINTTQYRPCAIPEALLEVIRNEL